MGSLQPLQGETLTVLMTSQELSHPAQNRTIAVLSAVHIGCMDGLRVTNMSHIQAWFSYTQALRSWENTGWLHISVASTE